jgi:hypothetical protein
MRITGFPVQRHSPLQNLFPTDLHPFLVFFMKKTRAPSFFS